MACYSWQSLSQKHLKSSQNECLGAPVSWSLAQIKKTEGPSLEPKAVPASTAPAPTPG